MKVLSIDPGYERLGIAVLEKPVRGKEILLFSECFKTPAQAPFSERLTMIGSEIEKVIKKFSPEALAIEELFFSGNQKTAMHVSEIRGAIIYIASKAGLDIFEYKPVEIKVAVSGYGKSDKKQVTEMVKRLIEIKKEIKHDDEYDAIAIGLTHFACAKQSVKK